MKILVRAVLGAAVIFVLASNGQSQGRGVIQDRFASVNGTRLHYLIAGKGDPVLLLHGYAENSHMWRPLMFELAKSHTVVAPDLRGFGQSSKPPTGYDKKQWRRMFMPLLYRSAIDARLWLVMTSD